MFGTACLLCRDFEYKTDEVRSRRPPISKLRWRTGCSACPGPATPGHASRTCSSPRRQSRPSSWTPAGLVLALSPAPALALASPRMVLLPVFDGFGSSFWTRKRRRGYAICLICSSCMRLQSMSLYANMLVCPCMPYACLSGPARRHQTTDLGPTIGDPPKRATGFLLLPRG